MNDQVKKASALHAQGAYAEALALYKKVLSQSPNDPVVLNLAAITALGGQDLDTAKRYATKSLKVAAHNAVAHNVLGSVFCTRKDFAPAIEHLRKAARIAPDNAPIQLNLAVALNAVFRSQEALEHAERAVALDDQNADALFQLAETFKALRRKEDAGDLLRKVVAIDPFHVDAWVAIAQTYGLDNAADRERFMAVLDHVQQDDRRGRLYFALASVSEKQGDVAKAFEYLEKGNSLIRSTYRYDVGEDERLLHAIAETWSRETIDALTVSSAPGPAPIFIVGMPRSGSTLVEQLLSGHSQISGGGEMPILPHVINDALVQRKKSLPQMAKRWRARDMAKLAERYLKGTEAYRQAGLTFTDKNLLNFTYIGPILAMFPNARIVHCVREPIENCLSIFRVMFSGQWRFAYDQTEIVRYYKAYQALMDHWGTVAPERIMTIRLEELIENPETSVQGLIEFCGLEWEPGCLDISKNTRPIHTLSVSQVQSTIASKPTSRQHEYEPYIRAIIEGFGR